ncbi:MAG: glycosyltransferase [Desulfobulbus sp.]|nr:glycosyltransferase [Desulfobulbus sp.]
MKKVLVIDEWIPFPLDSGKKIRTYNLLKHLAQSFEITLLCYGDADQTKLVEMEKIGIKVVPIEDRRLKKWTISFYARVALNLFESVPFSTVYHVRPELRERLSSLIHTLYPDVIHCEWTNLAPLLTGCDLRKCVISSHNIESDIWFRFAEQSKNPLKKFVALNQARKIEQLERHWYPQVAFCTAVSKNDSAVIEQYGGRSRTVENGVDVGFYRETDSNIFDTSIVFTASYDTFSNQDAAYYFIDEHWQYIKKELPDANLVFVGKNPTEKMEEAAREDSSIKLTGWVADVRPYIARARVCIVPLRIGGGSRLKIFEAMAMKKAIVSTTIGAEGIDVVDGRELLLRDDPRTFSEAVVTCYTDERKRQELGTNAFEFVETNYDWPQLANIQKQVWLDVAS